MTIVGMYLLIRYSKIKPDLFGTTVKPLIAALASAASAFGVYHLMDGIIGSARMSIAISIVVAIIVAVIVYIAVLLILRAFTATELKFLPKGEKIAKTLEKFGLIR
jgi:stage V sporulation protein B